MGAEHSQQGGSKGHGKKSDKNAESSADIALNTAMHQQLLVGYKSLTRSEDQLSEKHLTVGIW